MKLHQHIQALVEQATTTVETIQVPATKPLLMLPAPVVDPLMVEIEALAAAHKSGVREAAFAPAIQSRAA
jgi:hypothetical protein